MRTFDRSDIHSSVRSRRRRYYKFDQTVKCRNPRLRRLRERRRRAPHGRVDRQTDHQGGQRAGDPRGRGIGVRRTRIRRRDDGAIAARAGVPKANIHYYFPTKQRLYRAVVERVLTAWLDAARSFDTSGDASEALTAYIGAKMDLAREMPLSSQIW